jgi:hypothetical protein
MTDKQKKPKKPALRKNLSDEQKAILEAGPIERTPE